MAGLDEGQDTDNDYDEEEWEQLRKVRRFMELLRGRFDQREARILLQHHNWSLEQTVTFYFSAQQSELQQLLGPTDWTVVTYVRKNQVLKDLALRNEIAAEFRQFACTDCDIMFWRKVPKRKPVARCKIKSKGCRGRYEAIPREKEWGWAKFNCSCGNEFHAFGAMDISMLGGAHRGKSQSICYACMAVLCEPVEIIPPFKRTREKGAREKGARRRRYTHQCTAYNCYNRRYPNPGEPIVRICVHPNSLNKQVLEPSMIHSSTGSTVKTFLTQDELAPPHAPYEPSLADIDEDDGDNM